LISAAAAVHHLVHAFDFVGTGTVVEEFTFPLQIWSGHALTTFQQRQL
jgi:hypothetical protein